jgi:hypothetical protein
VLNLEPYAKPGVSPCEECPRQRLSDYLASSGGPLISAVIDLDFALQMKVAVSLAEIPYHVFLLLRQLIEERDKHQNEQIRNSRRN